MTTLKVDTDVLKTAAGDLGRFGSDLTSMKVGSSLSSLGSTLSGLDCGSACSDVGSSLDTASKKVGDEYEKLSQNLKTAADKYENTDNEQSQKIKGSMDDKGDKKDAGTKDGKDGKDDPDSKDGTKDGTKDGKNTDPSKEIAGPFGDPKQAYDNGATPTMAPAKHTAPLATNPPGYPNVGAGTQRDQNWTKYLNGENADGTKRATGTYPAALPDPAAVSDPKLRTIGAAARQQGVSYAWGANSSTDGPSRGTLAGDTSGDATRNGDDKRTGFDCGGLVRYSVYQAYNHNLDLGPGTGNQYSHLESGAGSLVSNNKAVPGDLLYWGNNGSEHVAINVGNGVLIQTNESGTGCGLGTVAAEDSGGAHTTMHIK